MKKLLSLTLCLVLAVCCLAPASAAEAESNASPVVFIAGLAENKLTLDGKRIWQPTVSSIVKASFPQMGSLISGLASARKGDSEKLVDASVKLVQKIAEPLRMNADGTSHYDVKPLVTGAESCSYNAYKAAGKLSFFGVPYGKYMLKDIAERIGGDRAFVFMYDWRLSADETADELKEFIDDVKTLTGSEKVSGYGNSFGTQVWMQYAYKYGYSDIDNLVLNAPAYAGSGVFRYLYGDLSDLDVDAASALRALRRYYYIDLDVEALLKILPKEAVNEILYGVMQKAVKPLLLYAPAFWGCCAADDYESVKAKLLDEKKDAAFIEKIDRVYNGSVTHLRQLLREMKAHGVKVSIVAGGGVQVLSGHSLNGDAVVDLASATGGEVLKLGETFADGRTGRYVSRAGDADMTNAYLPDNTWVIRGQTHGQSHWSENSRELIEDLLTTDDEITIDDREQFMTSECPDDGVSVSFDKNSETVKVTNLTGGIISLKSVTSKEYEISGDKKLLLPGKTAEFKIEPIAEASPYASVTVEYTQPLSFNPSRTGVFFIGAD